MPRVTRRQAAAAALSSSDAAPPAATTTAAPAKKRSIAAAKASDNDAVDITNSSPPDNTKAPPKKRKTTKGASTVPNGKVKDESPPPPVAEEKKAAEKVEKEPLAEAGIANSRDLVVPMDPLAAYSGSIDSSFTVYIDHQSGVIFDASLNQTNAQSNNNKFYIAQVLGNTAQNKYHCWTRWGRVGESGQSAVLGLGTLADAIKQFEKKFKDKSGLRWCDRTQEPKPRKYAYIERSYDPDSDDDGADDTKAKELASTDDHAVTPVECKLEKPVRELVELIFNQTFFNNAMSSFNYDANKLPLGKLGRSTITRGFQALKDLSAVLDDPTVATRDHNMAPLAAIEHFSNLYYSVIPHSFGRNRPPVINAVNMLKREVDMLESLSDMKAAADIIKSDSGIGTEHPLDRQFRGLNLEEMTPLDQSGMEFKTLTAYLEKSKGATHHLRYEIIDIFRIRRPLERERFESSKFSTIKSDKRLLWHGSRTTNFGGILSQGLRIAPPEAPINGYMFGKGIYLADMSSKSANYTCFNSSGGNGLLLLCEAELGDPMQELRGANANAGEMAKKQGMVSTLGVGDTGPKEWIDASAVHSSLKGVKMPDPKAAVSTTADGAALLYNEYIAYDLAQVQLRYLFRVKMSYS